MTDNKRVKDIFSNFTYMSVYIEGYIYYKAKVIS